MKGDLYGDGHNLLGFRLQAKANSCLHAMMDAKSFLGGEERPVELSILFIMSCQSFSCHPVG